MRIYNTRILILILFSSLLLIQTQIVSAIEFPPRPIINSMATNNPPEIDGMIKSGEWYNLQIILEDPNYPIDASVYFLNDNSKLYVLVDAFGDETNDEYDQCVLVFNFINQSPYFQDWVRIRGDGTVLVKSGSFGDGFDGAIGFSDHKFYEFGIPLNSIHASPGQSIDFCSPYFKDLPQGEGSIPFDINGTGPSADNIYPHYLETNYIDSWGILFLSKLNPVGGVLMPVNKFIILAPYIVFIGLVGLASTIFTMRKRYKN